MQKGPAYRASNAQSGKKKKARRTRLTGMLVVVVLVAVLFVVSLAVTRRAAGQALPESSAPPPAGPESGVSQPSPQPALPQPPEATGPYGLPELPPLYNYENFLPEGPPALEDVGNGQQMEPAAAAAFKDMQAAALAEGRTLTPVSGYRSHEMQTGNYNASIQRYLAQGIDEEEAKRLTGRYYAIPGTSEHEAGLAIDINLIEDSFAETEEFAWLQQHAGDYGFILRYRAETEEITRIAYEPWHYRFVGANHAKEIERMGVTLEEYIEYYNTPQPPSSSGQPAQNSSLEP